MFDDRLIIESPGPWMTGMDADDVRAGHSKIRNRAIARNLHGLDYIEERGTFWAKPWPHTKNAVTRFPSSKASATACA